MDSIPDNNSIPQRHTFKTVASFLYRNKIFIQISGLAVLVCFGLYFHGQYKTSIRQKTAGKIEDANMITEYIKNEANRVMASGRFQNLEQTFYAIRRMADKKGVCVTIFRSDGVEAFSDTQTADHVLNLARAEMDSGEKTIDGIPVSEIIFEAEEVLSRGRPDKAASIFDDPEQAHDQTHFEEAFADIESEDQDHPDFIERFFKIDREECGSACHAGKNAVIKMTIDKKKIESGVASELEWEMAKVAALVLGLLLVIRAFGKWGELIRREREQEREKYLKEMEDAYEKLQNLTQELSVKNEEISRYANDMEQLAEQRSKQLVHADRMSTLGIMSAGTAHEINNPNAFIRSNANMLRIFWEGNLKVVVEKILREDQGTSKKLRLILTEMPKLIKAIEEGTIRISKIVDGLKNFSRQKESTFEPTSLCDCILEAVEFSKLDVMLKNKVAIELDLPKDVPDIMLSRQEIEQVLINLFTNAAHAMEGIKEATLKVSVEQSKHNVTVVIADNGKGMDQETLNQIFTPFFTTKALKGGTGLGLPICYGIIEKHGGSIWADSSPGKGAIFTITLPKDKDKEDDTSFLGMRP